MLGRVRDMKPGAVRQAEAYFKAAYAAQMRGDLDDAITLYEKSLACVPTAEAHTFLGWTLSFKGDYAGAIPECHRAIEVDPAFGNPYNDIGSYLIALGRPKPKFPLPLLGDGVDFLDKGMSRGPGVLATG
jgi:tetratricopeptide (TPR) repeat protein